MNQEDAGMDPPRPLRDVCELVMRLARRDDMNYELVAALAELDTTIKDWSEPLEPFIEYVLLPLFVLIPSEASQMKTIHEPVLESALRCFLTIVANCDEQFGARSDLFFPVFLRGLASLTDVDRDGQLTLVLHEETKHCAIQLIDRVIRTQSSLKRVEDAIVFHTAALLLDSATKEKSRDLRSDALAALLTLVQRLNGSQLKYMFPGLSSTLSELARWDIRTGSKIPELASEALRLSLLTVHANTVSDDEEVKSYLGRLLPILKRIWRQYSIVDVPENVRSAHANLVGSILQDCAPSVAITEGARQLLLPLLITFCTDDNEEVRNRSQRYLANVRERSTEVEEPILFELELERMLVTFLVGVGHSTNLESDVMIGMMFRNAAFLVALLDSKHVRRVFEVNEQRILWALLYVFECETEREEIGRLEFVRVTSRRTLEAARGLFQQLKQTCPASALRLAQSLLESIESTAHGHASESLDDEDATLKLPWSYLAQGCFLACELSTDHQYVFDSLIRMERAWAMPTIPRTISPQEALWNALFRISALECLGRCAASLQTAIKFTLVDCLFPVLQCAADEHRGVRAAGEQTLRAFAIASGYTSDVDMLQNNIDYIVDALIRRLPQFSTKDVRFANVIEVLVERIPLWRGTESVSPWIQDLVQTVLSGLDDRISSPHVSWNLLRIAEVVVTKAAPEVPNSKTNPQPAPSDPIDQVVRELSDFATGTSLPNGEESEEEPEVKAVDQTVLSIEQIVVKCGEFLADDDVLVRRQAAVVSTHCILYLGYQSPETARKAIHHIWPTIIQQLREERHPSTLSLLLNALTVASSTPVGIDFFTRRFSEDAWPVLKGVLERAVSTQKKRGLTSGRNLDLALVILRALPRLGSMLIPRAEDIAVVCERFIDPGSLQAEFLEAKRLATDVWLTIAQLTGDVIWLPIAVAVGRVVVSNRNMRLVFRCKSAAEGIWRILEAQ